MLGKRIMELLNGIPQAFPTPSIVEYCKDFKSSRGRVSDQLRMFEKVGKVVKIVYDGERVVRWIAVKWVPKN